MVAMKVLRMAWMLASLVGGLAGVVQAQAQAVWQFVDREGVTHMGNTPPPASRGVIWLEGGGCGNSKAAQNCDYARG